MSEVEIRLLGGFEVRCGGAAVRRFESQKARGLLAYLALHRAQGPSREALASLLWSDRDESSARRNLRQVLYSLRTAFAEAGLSADLLDGDSQTVCFHPQLDLWIDVADFERAAGWGLLGTEPDSQQLGRAARLYVGDFLSGFFIRDCAPFEEWQISTQERLREAALATFHTLVASCLNRGESRMGIHYARRLLSIDPISERAHRQLMRLYAQSGRRTRALAQFEELRNLLNQELGVEPLAETTELYQSILLEELPEAPAVEEPIGPLIPLAGRGEEIARLQRSWQAAIEEGARLVLVNGESGVGKTRLIKTFVDGASSQRRTRVVRGRAYEASPAVAYGPWSEVVMTIFADLMPDEDLDPRAVDARVIADLEVLAPQLAALDAELVGRPERPEAADPERFAASLVALLQVLSHELDGSPTPIILMLSDLQWADEESLELLERLLPLAAELPLLIVADVDPAAPGVDRPLLAGDDGGLPIDRLRLNRLDDDELAEIAEALLPADQASWLTGLLAERTGGLPLAVTELINYLWDDGVLVTGEEGRWSLAAERLESCDPPAALDELIGHRFRGLPASARRLLALSGVIGQRFDVELLCVAGDEHLAVVEACVELMLQRWLIRQFPRTWTHTGRERDIVLFARGARRGVFEFNHEQIRSAILAEVNPLRRQVMHRDAAAALAEAYAEEPETVCQAVAHHLLEGGEGERALPFLALAAESARRAGAVPTERRCLERWLAVRERASGARRAAAERQRVTARLRQLEKVYK